MREIELVLGLLAIVVALAVLARRLGLPYPIVMVLAGLGLGLLPGLPDIELAPDIVFLVFLPPILYAGGFLTSLRDLKANLRPIALLAFGLVIVTAAGVAVVAHAMVPALGWAGAFVLGAIVSPPDAVAAMAIFQRLGVPRRVVTILEGESLVNDATALIIYRSALAALALGTFSLVAASLGFVVVLVGGVAVGAVVGWLVMRALERAHEPTFAVTITLLAPFAAYLPAEQLGVSGVIAAVVAGIFARRAGNRLTSDTRIAATAVWSTQIFVLNGLVFVLIGLQLRAVLAAVAQRSVGEAAFIALSVAFLLVVLRFVWVVIAAYVVRWLIPAIRRADPYPPWQSVVVIGWSGLRGVVSLAAALALPFDFPERDLVLFVTFVVILVTLVGQGLTLPLVIRALGLAPDRDIVHDEGHARVLTGDAALARLRELTEQWPGHLELIDQLRDRYEHRTRHHEDHHGEAPAEAEQELLEHTAIRRAVIEAERASAFDLHDRGIIDDEVLRRIERDLDLEELRMEA
ncbi:MAG: Na+/H+ antiporter [Chloroflexi bacterium]|nr:Na+/H+ antiporter [Chloroflexota bacterium]